MRSRHFALGVSPEWVLGLIVDVRVIFAAQNRFAEVGVHELAGAIILIRESSPDSGIARKLYNCGLSIGNLHRMRI